MDDFMSEFLTKGKCNVDCLCKLCYCEKILLLPCNYKNLTRHLASFARKPHDLRKAVRII
jgi:hypothetical protein